MQEPRTSIPKHHRFSGRRLAALLLLLALAAAACDSSGPDEPPCETPADCTTLDGIEQALDGSLILEGAVAGDSVFHVVLTQSTTERLGRDAPGSPYTVEEVWVFSRHAEGNWSAKNVSRSSTPSGGNIGGGPGQGALALDLDGTVHALWGELDGFSDPDEFVGEVAYARKPPGGRWSPPGTAYDAPPLSPDAFTGTYLPAFMAFDGDGTLHAAFTIDDGSSYGAVAVMSRRGGAWSAPDIAAEVGPRGSNTRWPHLASARDGSLLLTYVGLNIGDPERDRANSIRFRRSTDGGQTWSEPAVIFDSTPEEGNETPYHPRVIEGAPGTYHVLFIRVVGADDFPDQVWHSYSTDSGATWTDPQPVTPHTSGSADMVNVARDATGQVHLFYSWTPYFGNLKSNNDFGHRVWNGSRWEERPQLSQNPLSAGGFALASDPQGCLQVAWEEATDAKDVDDDGRKEPTERRLRYRRIGAACEGE